VRLARCLARRPIERERAQLEHGSDMGDLGRETQRRVRRAGIAFLLGALAGLGCWCCALLTAPR
jgi:hypothetical protein